MSTVKVVLGEGGSELTLDTNVSFTLSRETQHNPAGEADQTNVSLLIRGDVVAATPGSVWDGILELDEFTGDVAGDLGPQRVRIYLDDVVKWEWDPADCIGSPIVSAFRTFDDPGAGHGHWRYELAVFIQQSAEGSGSEIPQDVLNFTTSLAITERDGKVIRKTWRASGSAVDAATAEAAVKAYKPTSVKKNLVGTVETFNEEARATGVWSWELGREFGLEEEIEELGYGTNEDYAVDLRLGRSPSDRPAANLILLPKGAKTITVRGVVYGPTTPLGVPNNHYQDGSQTVAVRAKTRVYPTVVNPQDEGGGFMRRFEEVYLCTADVTPSPNHGDHANGVNKPAPPDGKAGS